MSYGVTGWSILLFGAPCAARRVSLRTLEIHPMTELSKPLRDSNEQLPNDVQQLIQAAGRLPETHQQEFSRLLDSVVENTTRRRQVMTLVQDALSQLRLDMKYLMFDLEATRRERDQYLTKLDQEADN